MKPLRRPLLAARVASSKRTSSIVSTSIHFRHNKQIQSTPARPTSSHTSSPAAVALNCRLFSSTPYASGWLFPKRGQKKPNQKGRPRVHTGGSSRGTTIAWGDYGLRMTDHGRRVSAAQLALGADTIKRRLKGEKFKLYTRVCANIGVYTSGNEMRMGKGKGSFDYWASRIPVSRIIFELKGEMHEKVARDAMRLAAAKMPGTYEFVKKGDPPVVGIMKVTDESAWEHMQRPRMPPMANITSPNLETTADRLPRSNPP